MRHVKRVKIRKQLLAALLCAVLFMGGVQSSTRPVWAAGQSTWYATNNRMEDSFEFALEDGTLVINALPSADGNKYAMVRIGDGEKLYFPIDSPEAIALPEEDGIYYVEIYLGKAEYGNYQGVIYDEDLGIEIKNGAASFVESPVYDNNRKMYEKASASDTALGHYTQPSHRVDSNASEIKALAKKIVNAGDSDYEKIRKVHDWVAANIWYDWDTYRTGKNNVAEASKVLVRKRAVCAGYANLTAALLRSLGIPTKVINGYALGASTTNTWNDYAVSGDTANHAWNEAYADGRWIILDTTWDSSNDYRNGSYSKGTGLKYRKYFDPTLEFFSMDHRIMPETEYSTYEREQAFEKALTLSKTSLTLKKGQTAKLTVKTSKKYIHLKDAKITYTSSNKKVASVSANGKIKAKKAGNALITVKIKLEGVTLTRQASVKVKNESNRQTWAFSGAAPAKAADADSSRFFYSDQQHGSLTSPQYFQLKVNQRMTVRFTVSVWVQMGVQLSIFKGTDISAEPVTTRMVSAGWRWNGANACYMDWIAVPLDPGTYTVRATMQNEHPYFYILEFSDNNGGTPDASGKVLDPDDLNPDKKDSGGKSAKLSKKSVTLTVGKKVALKVKNASGKVKWSSNNKKVAAVNSKGVVTAKKAGKATITARLTGGKKLKCKVTVKKK